MNFKKLLSILLVIVFAATAFVGCGKTDDKTNPDINTENIVLNANTISVSELKHKYGESDDGKILPLYNLDPNEPLAVSLKYTPSDHKKLFSIHTDEKCLEASEVALFWSPNSYMPSGPKTYEVKPIIAPLSNSSTQGLWGNVSNYYIKFNYDINAETETKLETPVIVPMSIKSPVSIPDTSFEIKDGNLTLKWTAVEGATAYRIYQRQVFKLLETANEAPKGKEEAYTGNFPLLEAEVSASTLSFNDWLGDGKAGQSKISSNDVVGGYIISHQNQGVNGEYYVTAVVNGKESLFSAGVATYKLSLPNGFKDGTSLLANTYNTKDELPQTVSIKYIDGSVKSHNVSYEADGSSNAVTYRVEGTSIIGYVTVKDNTKPIEPSMQIQDETGGFVEAEDDVPQNAPINVPTINDGKTATEDIPDAPAKPSTPTTPEDDGPTIIEQQIKNTEQVLENGNKETVSTSDDIIVNASSAAEEYLALNMIAGEEHFNISAFPEIQNYYILQDALTKVIYQNPFILGVRAYGYDYGSMTVKVSYDYTKSEMETRQKEIIAEGRNIISQVITSNMSDAEKRRAIYEYLENNTSYDDAALEDAEANNFASVDNKYKDSFSTYGILVKKVGVCQSYAFAFDYLCELADVECITVTGDMMGYLPHAWNKVKIGDEWFVVDVTNNEKSLGIEDFMFENPDSIAYAMGYIEDDLYYTDSEKGIYTSTSTKYSKYKDCAIDSKSALASYIKANAKDNTTLEFIATYGSFSSNDVVDALRDAKVSEIGNSIVICGYVLVEIVD